MKQTVTNTGQRYRIDFLLDQDRGSTFMCVSRHDNCYLRTSFSCRGTCVARRVIVNCECYLSSPSSSSSFPSAPYTSRINYSTGSVYNLRPNETHNFEAPYNNKWIDNGLCKLDGASAREISDTDHAVVTVRPVQLLSVKA
jgi:hypothetical protein